MIINAAKTARTATIVRAVVPGLNSLNVIWLIEEKGTAYSSFTTISSSGNTFEVY